MRLKSISWHGAVYYGEVFGFLLAWVAGIAIALSGDQPAASRPNADQLASAEVTAR
ncbi:hypothetical protein Mal64_21140 [Pseudobythopirellula maris]|uniref:Uncharacterized protein n=1 Tax=Pseudobythopirellula maris TaxID=2527991 RepID=A0A5C5ZN89_9BACT|nr:hypothetical protein [Pseudobythopirellula maris]TWT88628.1 hypothetical protein Mal64_21140 [Pseudobythopirellula maris]